MTKSIQRRQFIAGTIAAATAASVGTTNEAAEQKLEQEHYEYRIYRNKESAKQAVVSAYLKDALVPALNRLGAGRVGVFTPTDEKNADVHVVIQYSSLNILSDRNNRLAADKAYNKAAATFFEISSKDAPYTRIESRLLKAFKSIPVLELPKQTEGKKPRIFELRVYESHNEEFARRKVEMFDVGETEVMRKVNLAPVFFGENLISGDIPNLTYMLSADDLESHKQHFKDFLAHPDWASLKKIEKYKGTVSKITSTFLAPTDFSQI